MHEFYDMRDRILELLMEDDLSISEWRKWLPICRFADE